MVQRVAGTAEPANRQAGTSVRLARAHRVAAVVLAGLVLAQAVVAGQALFGEWDIRVHGWMGNASFSLGVVLAWLAWRGRAGRLAVATAAGLVVTMFVQIGLGYAGRTAAGAASWHVPLGVAVFGLAVAHASAAVFAGVDERR